MLLLHTVLNSNSLTIAPVLAGLLPSHSPLHSRCSYLAVRIILNIIGTIARRCATADSSDPALANLPSGAAAIWSRKQDKKRIMMAVRAFNKKPNAKPFTLLTGRGRVPPFDEDPETHARSMARLLRRVPFFSPEKVGEFLGSSKAPHKYVHISKLLIYILYRVDK